MAADSVRQRLARELLFASFARPSTEIDDPRSFERLAASVEAQTVRAGDVLFRAGDAAEHVYFMTEGRLRMARPGHADWVYEGWWVVGTVDVLAGRPRSRTATVEADTRLSRLSSERWFEVMRDRPEVLVDTTLDFARGSAALHARLAPDGGFVATAPPEPPPDAATLAGRVRLLAAPPLLRPVPVQVLVELAAAAEPRALAGGESLFAPGEAPGRAFVVARGEVEAFSPEPAASAAFGPGALVGGLLAFGDARAAWGARARGPTGVLSFRVDDLFDHLEGHHGAVRGLMASFAVEQERLREELAARTGPLVLR
jgi:CRP-like cAMP-binding protein